MKKIIIGMLLMAPVFASAETCETFTSPAIENFDRENLESVEAFSAEVIRWSRLCDQEATAIYEKAKAEYLAGSIDYAQYKHIMDNEYLPKMNYSSRILMNASLQLIKTK